MDRRGPRHARGGAVDPACRRRPRADLCRHRARPGGRTLTGQDLPDPHAADRIARNSDVDPLDDLDWRPLPAPSWLREVPLAHRGLHGSGVPENSLPAFAAAAEAGYGVELDVLLSRDEVPVINHDPSLRRVAGVDARVGDLTMEELAQVRLGGTDVGVPTLAAALQVLQRVPVMVEIKQGRPRAGKLERRVAEVVAGHPGPWCVAGFNPTSLRWFRRHQPEAIRVMTASPLIDVKLPGYLLRRLAELRDLPSVAPQAVSYDLDALPTEVTDRWRERGGALITWTAVGEEGLARARALADNVIFEHVLP